MPESDPSEKNLATKRPGVLRRARLAVSVLLLTGLMLGVVFLMLHHSGRHISGVVLPDGRQVVLLGTAFGDAPFTTDGRWKRVVRRCLPAHLLKWLPAPYTEMASGFGTNTLRVYLRILPSPERVYNGTPWIHFATEDAAGFRSTPDFAGGYGAPGPDGSAVAYLSVYAFPRRQQEFLLLLLDDKGKDAAVLKIFNPIYTPTANQEAGRKP
jgi:hypothetical protein